MYCITFYVKVDHQSYSIDKNENEGKEQLSCSNQQPAAAAAEKATTRKEARGKELTMQHERAADNVR